MIVNKLGKNAIYTVSGEEMHVYGSGIVGDFQIIDDCYYTGLNIIGQYDDFDARKIKTLYVSKDITELPKKFATNLLNLEWVAFENGSKIKAIPEKCFENLYKLENVCFPDQLEKVEKNAFRSCISLKKTNDFASRYGKEWLMLPETVQIIEDGAFFDCIHLNVYKMPNRITHIGIKAFYVSPWQKYVNEPNYECPLVCETPDTFNEEKGFKPLILSETLQFINYKAFKGRKGGIKFEGKPSFVGKELI